ncbi:MULTISPECIES: DUF2510 domain-containing protein [unclassified Curtobacterium]|uniref:DUF2510 domain-containing protein n=1 Tax=unclassified Curtobacterium TaxID=257496 RepID=UPI0038250E64
MSSTTPPGWYPDPSGRHGTRWWDGAGWTQHVGPPTPQMPRPRIPDGVRTDTVFVWVMALLPLVSLPLLFVYQPHFQVQVVRPGQMQQYDPGSIYTGAYFLVQGVGLLVYAAAVLLAYFDHRELQRRGVVRPFPWPWAFLSGIVYVIGRYVVVRKVAPGRSMWPLWTYAALTVVGVVLGIIRVVT